VAAELRKGIEALNRKDYKAAFYWLQKAADRGNAEAQFDIGSMYRDGDGVKQDDAQALSWLQKAAAQDYPIALDVLGLMYHEGTGVKQDYAASMDWSLKAAAHGILAAQARVGVMYMNGEGVKQDFPTALAWFQKAALARPEDQPELDVAEVNDAKAGAQFLLGRWYEAGVGTPKDPAQALYWYRMSAELGNAKAQARLAELHVSAEAAPEIMLWCDIPNFGLAPMSKGLVTINTKERRVKLEFQGVVLEWRNGAHGNNVRGGIETAQTRVMQQVVKIDGDIVRYGFKGGNVEEDTIDLRSGTMRSSGQVTRCTEAKR
jgi:TPR repeat protein